MGVLKDRLVNWLSSSICPRTLAVLRIAFSSLGVAALCLALQESDWLGGPALYEPPLWMDWMVGRSSDSVRAFLCLGVGFGLTSLVGLATPVSLLGLWLVLLNLRNHLAWAGSEGGLQVVQCALLCLLWTPCGGQWSMDSRLGWWRRQSLWAGPIRVLQLLQVVIYLESGFYKLMGDDWWNGGALLRVTQNQNFSRLAELAPAARSWVSGWMVFPTWLVLFWELTFPLWLLTRPSRRAAILVGVAMHLTLWLFYDVGLYPAAMLALYLTYLPGQELASEPAPSRGKKAWTVFHAAMILWAVLPVHRVYPRPPEIASPVPGLREMESAGFEARAWLLQWSPFRLFQSLVDAFGLNHRYNTFSPNTPNLVLFFRLRDEHGRLLWSDAPGEGPRYTWTVVMVRLLATTAPQALPAFFQKAADKLGVSEGLMLEEWVVELGQPASTQALNQTWRWRPARL
jgi:hypothetical protein